MGTPGLTRLSFGCSVEGTFTSWLQATAAVRSCPCAGTAPVWQLTRAHERLKMGWMVIEKETDGVAGGLHAGFGGAPLPPPPPPAHPVSVPPIARTAIASAPGVRIVAPSWGPQPLAHGAGDGKLGTERVRGGLSVPCRGRPSGRRGARAPPTDAGGSRGRG